MLKGFFGGADYAGPFGDVPGLRIESNISAVWIALAVAFGRFFAAAGCPKATAFQAGFDSFSVCHGLSFSFCVACVLPSPHVPSGADSLARRGVHLLQADRRPVSGIAGFLSLLVAVFIVLSFLVAVAFCVFSLAFCAFSLVLPSFILHTI